MGRRRGEGRQWEVLGGWGRRGLGGGGGGVEGGKAGRAEMVGEVRGRWGGLSGEHREGSVVDFRSPGSDFSPRAEKYDSQKHGKGRN